MDDEEIADASVRAARALARTAATTQRMELAGQRLSEAIDARASDGIPVRALSDEDSLVTTVDSLLATERMRSRTTTGDRK